MDLTTSKKCNKCGKEKPATLEFYHRGKAVGKLRGQCRVCVNLVRMKHYNSNKEKFTESRKLQYKKNPEEIKRKSAEYRKNNREVVNLKQKEYRKDFPDRIKAAKKKQKRKHGKRYTEGRLRRYREDEEYRDKICSNLRHRLATDPIFAVVKRMRCNIKKSLRTRGLSKTSKTYKILGCTGDYLYHHLCGTFEANYGLGRVHIPWNEIHIDHIIPMKTATTEEEVLKLNHYKNLQLLFACDNMEKSSKLDWEL